MFAQSSKRYYLKDAEVVSLDKVVPNDIEWLWPNHIPLGMLTLIAGDPGVGKSFLSFYLAATVSAGLPWPNSSGLEPPPPIDDIDEEFGFGNWKRPGSVIILNNDDIPTYVMRPRLSALNADLSKIKLIPFVWRSDSEGHEFSDGFNLATDLFALENVLCGLEDPKLIIIDPINSFFGRFDSCKYTRIHTALSPLIALASKHHVAVVGIMHLNKGDSSKMIYRTMGSMAFPSFARTVWFVTSTPDASNNNRRLFIPAKNNIVENPQPLTFEIKDNRIVFENQPVNKSSKDISSSGTNFESFELNRSVDWLKKLLADGNPFPSKKIFALAEGYGFKNITLQRARKKIDIKCFPKKDELGKTYWLWKLPILTKSICNHD
jgi:putative DNA primase/helicase